MQSVSDLVYTNVVYFSSRAFDNDEGIKHRIAWPSRMPSMIDDQNELTGSTNQNEPTESTNQNEPTGSINQNEPRGSTIPFTNDVKYLNVSTDRVPSDNTHSDRVAPECSSLRPCQFEPSIDVGVSNAYMKLNPATLFTVSSTNSHPAEAYQLLHTHKTENGKEFISKHMVDHFSIESVTEV